jgi:hypothetical protein
VADYRAPERVQSGTTGRARWATLGHVHISAILVVVAQRLLGASRNSLAAWLSRRERQMEETVDTWPTDSIRQIVEDHHERHARTIASGGRPMPDSAALATKIRDAASNEAWVGFLCRDCGAPLGAPDRTTVRNPASVRPAAGESPVSAAGCPIFTSPAPR